MNPVPADPGAKVVRLDDYRVKNGGDDAGFLACPTCQGDDFAVVCRGVLARPFVAALICVSCDPPTEIAVCDGYLAGVVAT